MKVWLLFVMSFLMSMTAVAGNNEVGDGGDYVASEFIVRGHVILQKLRTLEGEQAILTPQETAHFSILLEETAVESMTEELYDKNGIRVDARTIDHPTKPNQKLIQLDREKWLKYLADRTNIYRLIFHEYLWVLGKDDTNYVISKKLFLASSETIEVRTCGLSGTIDERLASCVEPAEIGGFGALAVRTYKPASVDPIDALDAKTYLWKLVARTQDRKQLWLDESSGLIWTAASQIEVQLSVAEDVCSKGQSWDGELFAGLSNGGLSWRLPSLKDYNASFPSGLKSALFSQAGQNFWTADMGSEISNFSYEETTGNIRLAKKQGTQLFRCVTSYKK